ncbi:MAG: tetratricopeptide repeat protein [Rickettsiales bacterium]|jgi:hypothetical protein|nr:tetratricopeptide repeat protein [Rickettsiales bacterium]
MPNRNQGKSLKEQYVEMQQKAFLREMDDDDVKADRLKRVWDRWHYYIIGAAVAVVSWAVMANWRETSKRRAGMEQAEKFERIISNPVTSNEGKILELKDFAKDARYGYRDIALFNAYSLEMESGKAAGAIATLENLAATAGGETYRNLAAVKLAGMPGFADSGGGEAAEKMLSGIGRREPFYYAARLRLAALYIRRDRNGEAKEILEGLVSDERAPAGIKSGGLSMLGFLKSKTAK